MERLAAGIDDKRATAPPVAAVRFGCYAVDIDCRVGTCKGHPEEVVQSSGGEAAVGADHYQGKAVETVPLVPAYNLVT